jgi:hypothetical protein
MPGGDDDDEMNVSLSALAATAVAVGVGKACARKRSRSESDGGEQQEGGDSNHHDDYSDDADDADDDKNDDDNDATHHPTGEESRPHGMDTDVGEAVIIRQTDDTKGSDGERSANQKVSDSQQHFVKINSVPCIYVICKHRAILLEYYMNSIHIAPGHIQYCAFDGDCIPQRHNR